MQHTERDDGLSKFSTPLISRSQQSPTHKIRELYRQVSQQSPAIETDNNEGMLCLVSKMQKEIIQLKVQLANATHALQIQNNQVNDDVEHHPIDVKSVVVQTDTEKRKKFVNTYPEIGIQCTIGNTEEKNEGVRVSFIEKSTQCDGENDNKQKAIIKEFEANIAKLLENIKAQEQACTAISNEKQELSKKLIESELRANTAEKQYSSHCDDYKNEKVLHSSDSMGRKNQHFRNRKSEV